MKTQYQPPHCDYIPDLIKLLKAERLRCSWDKLDIIESELKRVKDEYNNGATIDCRMQWLLSCPKH